MSSEPVPAGVVGPWGDLAHDPIAVIVRRQAGRLLELVMPRAAAIGLGEPDGETLFRGVDAGRHCAHR